MTDRSLKFSEFVDVLLVKLYEADRENPGRFFDFNALAADLTTPAPPDWVFDAAKVLESRLLAQCLYAYGATHARLTGEGRLYVEEGRGITRQVEERRDQYFVNVSGNQNQVVVGKNNTDVALTSRSSIETQRAPVFRELAEIRRILVGDADVDPAEKEEAQSLLKIVETELKKQSPRRPLIFAMLDALSKITSVATNVAALMRILGG